MAKYLRIEGVGDGDGGLGGMNFRLPGNADLKKVEAVIKTGFTKGAGIGVEVEMSDNPLQRARLVINGRSAACVLLSELPEPDDD